jgi:hypothetical protein
MTFFATGLFLELFAAQATQPSGIIKYFYDFIDKYQIQQFALPFLVTFVIVYGVLDMINIFRKNSINVILALAVSFFALFYGPYGSMGAYLTQLYGGGALIIVAVVIILLILGALSLGGQRYTGQTIFERLFGPNMGVFVGFIMLFAIIMLLATGQMEKFGIVLDPDTTVFLIIVLVLLFLLWAITRTPRTRTWFEMLLGAQQPRPG